MRLYLFGFLAHDFMGRVLVTPDSCTLAELAAQLEAWGPTPGRPGPPTMTNEAGAVLDPTLTVAASGLRNGDIVHVLPVAAA